MNFLLHAIPGPMLVEATFPPPSLQTHCLVGHTNNSHPNVFPTLILCWSNPLLATHRAPPAMVGLDGELWLPNDPFHGFDGPSVFGPETDWATELPSTTVSTANSSRPASPIDSEVNFTHLPPDLLDSPTPHPRPSRRMQYLSLSCPALLLMGPPQTRIPQMRSASFAPRSSFHRHWSYCPTRPCHLPEMHRVRQPLRRGKQGLTMRLGPKSAPLSVVAFILQTSLPLASSRQSEPKTPSSRSSGYHR
jgi:hypothetical protein